eukprot:TRINITY_DN12401_c0_g1_i1.p1 TRINITY_DN12401_c0_g1~~TRINITY_DN12401_c0_g1_i1.p1  ORF type:complete len:869 (-),score=198.78 TRINITY_DN12401_c0_g1_i1:376-2982(-)
MEAGLCWCWGADQPEPLAMPELHGLKYAHIAAGYEDAIVFADGDVIALGDSGFGDLIRGMNGVDKVAYGDGHVLVVTVAGRIYCAGSNVHGQVGNSSGLRAPVSALVTPSVLLERKVRMVAAGKAHSAALMQDGALYTWGRGFEGQLGHTEAEQVAISPKFVKSLARDSVIAIDCGDSNTAAITMMGLYTWGDGTSGQLGHSGKSTCVFEPRLVQGLPDNIQCVSVGAAHMIALDDKGQVWTWGLNTRLQLGHTPERKMVHFPTAPLLPAAENAKDSNSMDSDKMVHVAAGQHSSFCVSESGRVLSWGGTQNALLGYTTGDKNLVPPTLVSAIADWDVQRVFCSRREVVAFVPRCIVEVVPDCGVMEGGTELKLYGHGLPRTPVQSCQVRFTTSDGQEQVVPGEYCHDKEELLCCTPVFTTTGDTQVSVRFTDTQGVQGDFSRVQPRSSFKVYRSPEWVSLSCSSGPVTGSTMVTAVAQDVIISKHLSARVRMSDGQLLPVVDLTLNPEEKSITCTLPPGVAGVAALEVGFNGSDFEALPFGYTYYEEPKFIKMEPTCIPHQVGAELTISGSNIFAPQPPELLKVKLEAEDGSTVVVPGDYRTVGLREFVWCELPPWTCGGDRKVSLSFNNQNFGDSVPGVFKVYEPFTGVEFSPSCGPVEGGTVMRLTAKSHLFAAPTLKIRVTSATRRVECSGVWVEGGVEWRMPAWLGPPPLVPEASEGEDGAAGRLGAQQVEIGVAINGLNYQPTFSPFDFYERPSFSAVVPNSGAKERGEEMKFCLERVDSSQVFASREMRARLVWGSSADPEASPAHMLEFPVVLETTEEGADDRMVFVLGPDQSVHDGEAGVHVAVNGQQFVDTSLKVTWK